MLGRLAACAVVMALAGCAGMEPAGRNARTSEPTRVAATPPPVTTAPAPARAPVAAAPPPVSTPAPAPVVAAPPAPQRVEPPPPQRVEAPPPPEREVAAVDDRPVAAGRTSDEVIVPGQRERQVPTPDDPRSTAQRMQDINAWDQCVMRVQSAFEADPMSAQLDQPEDYCARSLGMANRTAIPESRRERRP